MVVIKQNIFPHSSMKGLLIQQNIILFFKKTKKS